MGGHAGEDAQQRVATPQVQGDSAGQGGRPGRHPRLGDRRVAQTVDDQDDPTPARHARTEVAHGGADPQRGEGSEERGVQRPGDGGGDEGRDHGVQT
ncbi:hypothetical protein ABZ281_40615 [Streptomyces sp. NPDC006265]|uniref:hypothetical protein n=1 Tax=Streptomyces sp. NPDC006265 TaxID=3156740 RepID=UPI0033AF6FF0